MPNLKCEIGHFCLESATRGKRYISILFISEETMKVKNVLVMAEDEQVKQNRLALVGQIANLSKGIADLSKLEGF